MPIDLGGALDPKHNQEIGKTLKKCLTAAKKAIATLDEMKPLVQKHPVFRGQMGKINKEIYGVNPRHQLDGISALPTELKYEIWSHLDDPADRIMLALTCKWHAATFEDLKSGEKQVNVVKSSSKKPKAATPKKSQCRVIAPPKKQDVIRVMQRLQDWVPRDKLKLCHLCWQFKPKNSSSKFNQFSARGNWGGAAYRRRPDRLTPRLLDDMATRGYRCPDCCNREDMRTQQAKREFKEFRALMARLS